jgi:hypothetical protein
VQVVVRPTQKQMRRRGKRSWTVVAAIDAVEENNGHVSLPRAVQDAVLQALKETLRGELTEKPKTKKSRKKARS